MLDPTLRHGVLIGAGRHSYRHTRFFTDPAGIAVQLTVSYIFELDVTEFSTDLLRSSGVQENYDIRQYYIRDNHRHNGAAYGDVMDDLQEQYESLPIGIHK